MNTLSFLTSFLTNIVLLPALILCLAPMTGRFKRSFKSTVIFICCLSLATIVVVSLIESTHILGYQEMILPVFLVTFTAYHKSLSVSLYKSLFVYTLVFTYMSFLSNFATGFDAVLHPDGTVRTFSLAAAIFQASLSIGSCGLFFYPLNKFGGSLINSFDIPRIYVISIPIWGIFLGFNLLITPRKYETIHVNLMQFAFWGCLTLFFVLFLLLCILYYLIVNDMLTASQARERARILEMQESYFQAQQRYMNETARVRHDFKHTIGAITMLINDGDISAAKYYLNDYMKNQPRNETVNYCDNLAVNALLNYYENMAENNRIRIEMEVSLPGSVPVSDTDLCSILGNILENAILACDNLPEKERFIDLAIRQENDSMLYIVATNSFDGKANKSGDAYVSTRRSGSGIGLRSIKETAEKYGGSVRFSHEWTEFYTDVVLPI